MDISECVGIMAAEISMTSESATWDLALSCSQVGV